MTWKMWLDDQGIEIGSGREVPEGFIGALSTEHAMEYISELGLPFFIDFDHDLGGDDDAIVFLKTLLDSGYPLSFEYKVHSANPIGRERIISFIESWRKVWGGQ